MSVVGDRQGRHALPQGPSDELKPVEPGPVAAALADLSLDLSEVCERDGSRRSEVRLHSHIVAEPYAVTSAGHASLARLLRSLRGGDVNLNAIDAAVIGGTSLFGGRGSAFAALLSILVIWSVSSGLTLVDLDSSIRQMVTGAVVFIAVGLGALACRSRSSHGRA